MIISCNTIVDRRDHVQYLTVSKSYSDNCTCSLTEQNREKNKTKKNDDKGYFFELDSVQRCHHLW